MQDTQLNQRRWGYHALAKPKLFEAGVPMLEGWSPVPFGPVVDETPPAAPETTYTPEKPMDEHPKPKRKYTRRKAS